MGKPPGRKGGRNYSERFERIIGKVAETEYRHQEAFEGVHLFRA